MASNAPDLGALGEALIAIRADLATLRTDMAQAKVIVQKGADDIQKSTETLGKTLSVSLSAPILAVGAAAVLVGKQYDEVMDDIRASTGATGAKLDSLGQSFRNVFKNVPNDAKEVSAAIIELNQRLNLSGPALDEMATQFLNLARVGKTEVGPLIADATRLFGAWNVATEDQSSSLDTLFKITQQTGIKIGDLVGGLTQAAPIFKQFGFDLTTSAAMLGQWEKAGINGEAALNGLRLALVNFAKQGIDAKQGLQDVVDKMTALGPGAAQSKIAVETFGRGAVAMTDAINRGAFSVDALVKSITDSKETINQAAFDTLSFADKWKVLQHQVEAALEPLGAKLLSVFEAWMPKVEKGVELVANLIEKFRALPDAAQDTVIALGAVLAVIGPGILVVTKFVDAFSKLKTAIAVLQGVEVGGGVLGWLSGGAGGLAAGAGAPIVLGILAAAGALLVFKTNMDKLQAPNKDGQTIPGVSSKGAVTTDQAKGAADMAPLVNGFQAVFANIAKSTTSTYDPLADFMAQLQKAREDIDNLSSAQRNQGIAALIAGAEQKKVQDALGLNDLAMALFSKSADKAKTSIEALQKAQKEYADAADSGGQSTSVLADAIDDKLMAAYQRYLAIQTKIGDATYEGIKADHDAGISVASLAAQYGVGEVAVNQVIKSEEELKKALDETFDSVKDSREVGVEAGKALTAAFAGMPAVLKDMSAGMAVFDENGGLVSGSLLASHSIANLTQQGQLMTDVYHEAGLIIGKAMVDTQRSFLPLNDAQKLTIQQMHTLGFSAQEIAAQFGISLRQVDGELGFTREQFHSTLDSMSTSLTQLAQVSGGTFGGLIKGISQVVVSWNAAAKAADAYRDADTTGGKVAALAQGAVAVAGATQGGGTKGVIGGALSGAEMGAVFGPWGAAAGAVIGGIIGFLRTDHRMTDVARDAGQKFGVTFSDATNTAIKASMDAGMTETAAEISNLDKIIGDAGGLTAKNIDQLTRRLRDTFSMVQTGELTAAQGADVLNKNFMGFVTAATSGVGVLNSRVTELIKLNDAAGTSSAAIASYVSGQVKSNVFGGLTAGLGQGSDASAAIKADQKTLLDLQDQLSKASADAQADIQKQIDDTNADLLKQQQILSATSLTTQGAASAAAGAILAGIAEEQKQGVDFVTALTDATPAIQALQAQLEATGFSGGAAFAQIKSYVDLASDSIAGPALKSAEGFGQALVGLNNSGLLTQEMFSGLAGQIAATRDNLVAQGKDGGAVMKLLAPQLQEIWEIQKQTGMSVDATTQSLLDEAVAQGVVGEKFEGPQQQMIDALTQTNDILTAIGKALGADLPADAAKGAAGVQKALDGIEAPDVVVGVRYQPRNDFPGAPPVDDGTGNYAANGGRVVSTGVQYFDTSGIVRADTQYFATSGIVGMRPRGKDTVGVMASPGELLLNIAHQGNLASAIQTATEPQDDGQPVEMALAVTVQIGNEKLGTFTEKVTWPELKAMFKANRGSARTDAQAVLQID